MGGETNNHHYLLRTISHSSCLYHSLWSSFSGLILLYLYSLFYLSPPFYLSLFSTAHSNSQIFLPHTVFNSSGYFVLKAVILPHTIPEINTVIPYQIMPLLVLRGRKSSVQYMLSTSWHAQPMLQEYEDSSIPKRERGEKDQEKNFIFLTSSH